MVQQGYYFFTPKCDYFFVTDAKIKSPQLVAKIDAKLKEDGCTYRGSFGTFELKDMLEKATIEHKKTQMLGWYYDVKGDGFSGGSFDNVKQTKIIQL